MNERKEQKMYVCMTARRIRGRFTKERVRPSGGTLRESDLDDAWGRA